MNKGDPQLLSFTAPTLHGMAKENEPDNAPLRKPKNRNKTDENAGSNARDCGTASHGDGAAFHGDGAAGKWCSAQSCFSRKHPRVSQVLFPTQLKMTANRKKP
jgi:hypothetical protein